MKIEIHRVSLGLLALMTLGGCASFNDCYYEKTQRVRALKEYVHCGKPQCSEYPRDYKLGWIDGFYEVATGGSDCPPSVAPARYYEPKEILKYCDKRRHDYYSGWQDGAARASQFPDTHYLRIYETEECPFPRCEKPCSNGQCGPCREAFVGMTAATEMIEIAPTSPPTTTSFESIQGDVTPTGANEATEWQSDTSVELTIPAVNDIEHAPIETSSQSIPSPGPTSNTLTDLPTLPMIPPAPTASAPQEIALTEPAAAKPAASADDSPLISIPGYRATTQWNQSAAQPTKAQPVGFIRMVKPIQDAQAKRPSSDGTEPIVIVDAPYQHFQLNDNEAKPVIQLVE